MVDQGDDTTMKSFDMTRNKNDQLSILDHTEYEQLMDFRSRMDQMQKVRSTVKSPTAAQEPD